MDREEREAHALAETEHDRQPAIRRLGLARRRVIRLAREWRACGLTDDMGRMPSCESALLTALGELDAAEYGRAEPTKEGEPR